MSDNRPTDIEHASMVLFLKVAGCKINTYMQTLCSEIVWTKLEHQQNVILQYLAKVQKSEFNVKCSILANNNKKKKKRKKLQH